MKILKKVLLYVLLPICIVIILGITNIVPYFAVIPDMVKVGVDYISLDRNKNTVSEKELAETIPTISTQHPFVLADKKAFDTLDQMTVGALLVSKVILPRECQIQTAPHSC